MTSRRCKLFLYLCGDTSSISFQGKLGGLNWSTVGIPSSVFHSDSIGEVGEPDWSIDVRFSCFHGDWSLNGTSCVKCCAVLFEQVVETCLTNDSSLESDGKYVSVWLFGGAGSPFSRGSSTFWDLGTSFRRRLREFANQFFSYGKITKEVGR